MKIWKTIIICCLSLTLMLSLGITNSFAESERNKADTQNTIKEAERLFEVEELREKNSKTYQLSNGDYQYVGYAEDIHYEDTNGKLKEIDNSITDKQTKEGYVYSNTANAWHTYFGEDLSKKDAVILEKDDYKVGLSLVDAQSQSKATNSSVLDKSESALDEILANDNRVVVYKNVLNNVDVAYTVRTNGLKEDIILRDASAPNFFEFDVTVKGLSILEKEGMVTFVNSKDENVFQLAPMYMEDANGKHSEKVEYTLEKSENGYRIAILADADFLASPDTQYPVIIDPSVMISGSSNTFDTCVDEQYPTSNYYLSENLWTGGKTGTNTMRTYMRFNLPANIPGSNVSSAYIRIKKRDYENPGIKAYRVLTSWASSAVTWNNRPGFTTTDASSAAVLDTGSWYKINATTLVRKWMNGTYVNHGFLLKEPSETSTSQKTRFYSSDAPSPNKPELVITYTALRPLVSYDLWLYKNSAMSTSFTTLQNYISTANTAFTDTYRVQFNRTTSATSTALNQRSGCQLSISQICNSSCDNNADCKEKHHKAGYHFLYVHETSSTKVFRYVDFAICRTPSGGSHGSINGAAVANKNIIVTLQSSNIQRTTSHELSHWIGANDNVCVSGQSCVMTYGSNVYNLWCTQCKKDIVEFLE